MKYIYPKSLSWIIYGATTVFVVAMVIAALQYRKSEFWEQKYDNLQTKEITNYEKLKEILLLLANTEFENKLLLKDYFELDSLLFSEKLLNADLNKQLQFIKAQYQTLVLQNSEIAQQLKMYQDKILSLTGELQQSKLQLEEISKKSANLQSELNKMKLNENKDIFTVEFLSSYKLINIHSTPINITKKGEIPTRKIKQTDIIKIDLQAIPNLNFDLGNKTIYVRIADPDGTILPFMKDEVDLFVYQGEEILFTDKKDVKFSTASMPITIEYHPVTHLKPGTYWVYVFCDGIRIGESSFDLF